MKPRRIESSRRHRICENGFSHDHARIISEADYQYLRRVEKAAIAVTREQAVEAMADKIICEWSWDATFCESVAEVALSAAEALNVVRLKGE